MNGKLVCLLAVICGVILVDTDAFRIRLLRRLLFGRRSRHHHRQPVCREVCFHVRRAHSSGHSSPRLECRQHCHRNRRSSDILEDNKVIVPLPRDFDLYDKNDDGQIQIEEFAQLIGLESTRDDVIKAFSLADSDDDSLITEVELLEAPWVFENEDTELPPPESDQFQ